MEIKKPQLGKVGAFAIFLKREVLQHLPAPQKKPAIPFIYEGSYGYFFRLNLPLYLAMRQIYIKKQQRSTLFLYFFRK